MSTLVPRFGVFHLAEGLLAADTEEDECQRCADAWNRANGQFYYVRELTRDEVHTVLHWEMSMGAQL